MKLCMDLCLAAVFIRIIWTDIRTMTIPDNVLVPLVILAAMSVPAEPEISLTARDHRMLFRGASDVYYRSFY